MCDGQIVVTARSTCLCAGTWLYKAVDEENIGNTFPTSSCLPIQILPGQIVFVQIAPGTDCDRWIIL